MNALIRGAIAYDNGPSRGGHSHIAEKQNLDEEPIC